MAPSISIAVLSGASLRDSCPGFTASPHSRELVQRTVRRLRSFHHCDPGVDAYCREERDHFFRDVFSTLCHEYCHHLDFQLFKFADSWRTRGFYERAAALYDHARGTAPKRLFWVPIKGGRWRIDWPRTNRV